MATKISNGSQRYACGVGRKVEPVAASPAAGAVFLQYLYQSAHQETFLTANSGLASRFPNKIEFPDYTADELLDITNVLARGKGYRLAESCTEPLRGYYERRQAEDARTAGNGRLARNTLEKAIFHQSRRLVAEPAAELDVILPSDLELQ